MAILQMILKNTMEIKVNKGAMIFGAIILLAVLVSAIEFVPQGDIQLKNIYNILNVKNINQTGNYTFYGDTFNITTGSLYVDGEQISAGVGTGDITSVLGDRYIINGSTTGAVNLVTNTSAFNETISDRGVKIGFNSTFNSTYAQYAYNQSDGSFNSTYAQFAYNHTSASNSSIVDAYGRWFYNQSDGTGTGNASWNQSYADTLYSGIEWDYNQTVPANSYTDSEIDNINTTSNIQDLFNNQNHNNGVFNFTTTGSGFFGFLGSVSSRVTKGWFTSVDIGSTGINSSGNVTLATSGQRFCFNEACSSYIFNNGTDSIWK